MRYARGKRARWARYDLTWRRYLRRIRRMGPVLKTRTRVDSVPTLTAYTRDSFAETRRRFEGRFSGHERHWC